MAQLLITGGAGFIGSHTCLALLKEGHNLFALDNYCNSSPRSLERVSVLAGIDGRDRIKVVKGDIRNKDVLRKVFGGQDQPIDAVVHFAGLKAVGESFLYPLSYWDVNVNGTLCLLEVMKTYGCRTIVFSSSATVYGFPQKIPTSETSNVQPINPYGSTKAAVEQLLAHLADSEPGWRIACLRYFNPVGAHPSGSIGEAPIGIPNNLFPFVSQVAVGIRKELEIFGADWPTPDGTPVRDYIHVMDLAEGHCAALQALLREPPQLITTNLGSGQGYSVLQIVKSFEEATGRHIPYKITPRRQGDAAFSIADPTFAKNRLGWATKRTLLDMCRDSWVWQQLNPFGYGDQKDDDSN